MNLTCPSCDATFFVDPAQLGAAGRAVRCGSCSHKWHQTPPEAVGAAVEEQAVAPPAVETEAPPADAADIDFAQDDNRLDQSSAPETPSAEPPAVDDSGDAPAIDDSGDAPAVDDSGDAPGMEDEEPLPEESRERMPRRARSRPIMPPPKKRNSSLAVGWVLLIVVVAGLGTGFYYGRKQIVAAVPEMARLYALTGVSVTAPGEGLELREVKSARRLVDGERVVVIEGLVANISGKDQAVPLMRASLTDSKGAALDQWTFSATAENLPPGGVTEFETSTQNPPREGNLSIEFVAGH